MKCPRCSGAKIITASHVAYADGSHAYNVDVACDQCGGVGEVSDEMTNWIIVGSAMRADRLHRQLTLREEAKRREMSVVALSQMEFGKIKPIEATSMTLKEAIEKARGGPPPTPFQGFA